MPVTRLKASSAASSRLADVIAVNKADGDGEVPARSAAKDLTAAMRLMLPGKDVRRPPVLTCSAQTGAGLDEVWAAVLDHRAHLESEGSLEQRRARQQQDWMWALVDAHLEDAVRSAPGVREQRARIEAAVRSGKAQRRRRRRADPRPLPASTARLIATLQSSSLRSSLCKVAISRRGQPVAGVFHPAGAMPRRLASRSRTAVTMTVATTFMPAETGDPCVDPST